MGSRSFHVALLVSLSAYLVLGALPARAADEIYADALRATLTAMATGAGAGVVGPQDATSRRQEPTRCPVVPTQCPPARTACPVVETQCPPVETACPAKATQCPAVSTQCPAQKTACPAKATQCPAG